MSARDLLGWQQHAACADTPIDMWFPTAYDSIPDEVRDLCGACPVRQQCLDHALRYERHGTWAATSARGRARLRRTLRIRLVELDHDDFAATVLNLADQGTPPPQLQSSSA